MYVIQGTKYEHVPHTHVSRVKHGSLWSYHVFMKVVGVFLMSCRPTLMERKAVCFSKVTFDFERFCQTSI